MSAIKPNNGSDDARLGELLRSARPQAELPPGFSNAVWRRIERANQPSHGRSLADSLDLLVGWLLRPRFALALAAVMMISGTIAGISNAGVNTNRIARDRYVASVNPPDLRP